MQASLQRTPDPFAALLLLLYRLSKEEHREDALALRAEERRDKLRKAVGSRKWAVIHGSLNGETRLRSPQSPCHEKEATPHSGMEGTR